MENRVAIKTDCTAVNGATLMNVFSPQLHEMLVHKRVHHRMRTDPKLIVGCICNKYIIEVDSGEIVKLLWEDRK